MDWICGNQDVPVTVPTLRGRISTILGITYVNGEGEVLILDVWINQFFKNQTDRVEQARAVNEASRILVKALDSKPRMTREWEGVLYG